MCVEYKESNNDEIISSAEKVAGPAGPPTMALGTRRCDCRSFMGAHAI